jgi:hypothetical protein
MAPRTALAFLAVVLVASRLEAGGLAQQCRQSCDASIARCVAAAGPFGVSSDTCRRAVLRQCKRTGIAACRESETDLPASDPLAGTWMLTLHDCAVDCRAPGDFTVDCGTLAAEHSRETVVFARSSPDGYLTMFEAATGDWWGSGPGFVTVSGKDFSSLLPLGPHFYMQGVIESDRIAVETGVWISVSGCPEDKRAGEMIRIACTPGVVVPPTCQ